MSVFNTKAETILRVICFYQHGGVIQRFDVLKYRQFDKLTDKQLGFFWRPEEVDITKDTKDFRDLTDTNNIFLQVILSDKFYLIVYKDAHLILHSCL